MSAARRVRCDMIERTAQASYPRPTLYMLVEYPRISSMCANRRPLWEWRLDRAVAVRLSS